MAAIAYMIICFVCGIRALSQIRLSGGLLRGNGYVMPSILMPIVIALWLVSFLLAINLGMRSMMRYERLYPVRHLGNAMLQYRSDHDGSLPPPDSWCDVIKEDKGIFGFKESREDVYTSDYALNVAATDVVGELPYGMVILFEAEQGWNLAGGIELLRPEEESGWVRVYLAGAGPQVVQRSEVSELRWKVDSIPEKAAPPLGGYVAAGGVLVAVSGGIIAGLRRRLRRFALAAAGLGVLSAGAGTVCGILAEVLYLASQGIRIGAVAGASVGFLAGVCFVLVLGYARDRMRPGMSMVGFATVAGAITGAAASTAVHVFLMIGYNDWHVLYPLAGAGFGIWAGILLGWLCSNILTRNKTDKLSEGLT